MSKEVLAPAPPLNRDLDFSNKVTPEKMPSLDGTEAEPSPEPSPPPKLAVPFDEKEIAQYSYLKRLC